MKKRKVLALIPMVALFLTGCDLKATLSKAKDWISDNIYHPIKDFIDGETGEDKKEDEGGDDKGDEGDKGGEDEPEINYDFVIDSKSSFNSKDDGYLYQLDLDGCFIDAIGYEKVESSLGSIKKVTYNSTYTFNGMVYNRSLINGLDKLCVTFEGGTLQYLFSEHLMEDMDFDEKTNNNVESGKVLEVPKGKGYFVFYNKSTTPITIESVKVKLDESKAFDAKMVFNKDSQMGGARSLAKRTELYDSFVELENNPTAHTNNYSEGKHDGHTNNDSWYRWNGRYFAHSETLGTNFRLGMTVMGNLSQVVNEESYFHYAVWPQMGWRNADNELYANDNTYVQTYIGNDNYDPLGIKSGSLKGYPGRFFSDYGWYNEQWMFPNPETTMTMDGKTSFKAAYEKYNLPFWFIEFDFSLNDENMPICSIYINGFHLFDQEIFEEYDTVNKPGLEINSMPMHVVNYGNPDGSPCDSYIGCFTYPRLMA